MNQTPKIGIDQFWEVLSDSKLVAKAEVARLRKESTAEGRELEHAEDIGNWLVAEKILTPLQTRILLSGHSSPFDFGRYRIIGRHPEDGIWLARDRRTAHPVWLHFLPGETRDDLPVWDAAEARAEQFAEVDHPNLIRVYETIVTRTHRFVATAVGGKESLASRMPPKRRLTQQQSIDVIREVAAAIAAIHETGLAHGSLSLKHVFPNVKSGVTKVLMPVAEIEQPTEASDSCLLGQMLFRLLIGKEAPPPEKLRKTSSEKFAETLGARKISPEVSKLVYDALLDDKSASPADFLQRINDISDTDYQTPKGYRPLASEAEFLEGLNPWRDEPQLDESVPDLEEETVADAKVVPARPTTQLPVGVSVGLTLFGFAALLGIAAFLANLKKLDRPKLVIAGNENVGKTNPVANEPEADLEAPGQNRIAASLAKQRYVQVIVEDDRQTLWESPTTGFPIDISFVPPSPRIIATANWNSLQASDSGTQSLKALGPNFESRLRQLESRTGFSLAEIDSTVISLHSNLSFEYDSFIMVNLAQPASLETCLEKWNQPDAIADIDNAFETTLGDSWWIAKSDPESGKVLSFVVGPGELVQQVARGEVAALTGTVRKLVESSDANRDVTLVLPVISLFNTEGQKLFAGYAKWMNELRLALPESVTGFSLSFHHDGGDYVEMRFDHTADLKAKEAATLLRERIGKKIDQTQTSIENRQALPFWEPVRSRYSAMLRDLGSQLRWDSEFGEAIGNVWLPPGAMHNLLAASELAMTFEPTEELLVAATDAPKTPQTLEELLATRRDLSIANPPDLNVLLRNISEEVSDQYLNLPFEFNIRIAGTDLQKDGITQNQRPGPLQISNKSVAEILTQVMVSANPNREITGPSDPDCKLVWVVNEDPEAPGMKYILITTRAAAAQNGYALPDAFIARP